MYAARAQQEALHLNRPGEFKAGADALRAVACRIKRYAGSDTEPRDLAGQLMAEEAAFSAPMSVLDRKRGHFASMDIQRSRDAHGQARR